MTHAEENDDFEAGAEDMELYSTRRQAEADMATEAYYDQCDAEEEASK